MAEAAFRQMIAASIRQTRPQSFRLGKPLRYPQRPICTATAPQENSGDQQSPSWRPHPLPAHDDHAVGKPRLAQLREDMQPRSFSSFLTDNYSREHNYLRISVTERCNLRCLYCMPEEGVPLSPPANNLTTPEIVYLSSLFVSQGVDKIRLTGGEPTVRKDIVDLMHQIGQLRKNGLKELCLTTNGISLHRKLDAMVDAGLTGINLSLDTLDPFQFTLMTRRNGHEAVMKSIHRILEMNKMGAGIKLKINCVVMRGINEREILPFVEKGKDEDLEVRFIEYMPFDGNKWSQKKMLSFHEMLALIEEKYPDVQKVQGHANDTSKTYQIPGFKGRIGFITSMTHNFCGTCNRLRITSDGNLKVCLFGNSEVSLRDLLRELNDGQPIDAEAMEAIKQLEMDRGRSLPGFDGTFVPSEHASRLLEVIGLAVKRKKEKHAGMGELENMKNRPMILIDPFPSAFASFPQPPKISYNVPRQFGSVPLHILPANPVYQTDIRPRFEGRRWMSTRQYFRKIRGQSTYRRIALDGPVPAARTLRSPRHEWSRQSSPSHPDAISGIYRPLRARYLAASGHSGSDDRSRTVSGDTKLLNHLTSAGHVHMVDISQKKVTSRSAVAQAVLYFSKDETYKVLENSTLKKGDALAVARIAAIQAAKKTPDLIPLAHPGLGLTGVDIDLQLFRPRGDSAIEKPVNSSTDVIEPSKANTRTFGGVFCIASVSCDGKTGVEMEALTSATVAALTMYDMLKGVDKGMRISGARVLNKRGGKSGDWHYDPYRKEIVQSDSTSAAVLMESGSTAVNDKGEDSLETDDGHTLATISTLPSLDENTDSQLNEASPPPRQSTTNDTPSFAASQDGPRQQESIQSHSDVVSSIEAPFPSPERERRDLHPHSSLPAATSSSNPTINQSVSTNQHRTSELKQSSNHGDFTDTHQVIRFDRTTREKMSGTWSDRFDSRDFQTKRIERYEDWARER